MLSNLRQAKNLCKRLQEECDSEREYTHIKIDIYVCMYVRTCVYMCMYICVVYMLCVLQLKDLAVVMVGI